MSITGRTSLRRLRTAGLIACAALAVSGVASAAGDPAKPAAPDDKVYGTPSASTEALGAYVRKPGNAVTLPPFGFASGIATCPAGYLVMGGGESNSAPGTLVLTDSWPLSDTQWLVYVKSNDSNPHTFTPWAVCAI